MTSMSMLLSFARIQRSLCVVALCMNGRRQDKPEDVTNDEERRIAHRSAVQNHLRVGLHEITVGDNDRVAEELFLVLMSARRVYQFLRSHAENRRVILEEDLLARLHRFQSSQRDVLFVA